MVYVELPAVRVTVWGASLLVALECACRRSAASLVGRRSPPADSRSHRTSMEIGYREHYAHENDSNHQLDQGKAALVF